MFSIMDSSGADNSYRHKLVFKNKTLVKQILSKMEPVTDSIAFHPDQDQWLFLKKKS